MNKDKTTSKKKEKAVESKPVFIERAEFFLEAWIKKDWKGLIQYTQKTWNSQHSPQDTHLKIHLKQYDIKNPAIESHNKIGHSHVQIMFKATMKDEHNKEDIEVSFVFSSICEVAPFKADHSGEWGINPTSIRRIK